MILHFASVAAFLMDQTAPAPIPVQCIQSGPEPEWKWWLKLAAEILGPLLSTAGSIYVAWRVFRWQGKKDRERWLLDQKKAEWSCLLRSVASVYQITDLVHGWNRKVADKIVSELEPALKEVSIARANCVFLDKFRLNKDGGREIREFLREAEIQLQKIRGNLGWFDSILDGIEKAGSRSDQDTGSQLRCIEVLGQDLSNLAEQSRTLLDWLQDEAALDLGVTAKGEEHGAAT